MAKTDKQKQDLVLEMAEKHGCRVFVETETGDATMLKTMFHSKRFKQLHTISETVDAAMKAKNRLSFAHHVHCWSGDSANRIKTIMRPVRVPAIFWLNRHPTKKQVKQAKGRINVSLRSEVDAILETELSQRHVILIDDEEFYTDQSRRYHSVPGILKLEHEVNKKYPGWKCTSLDGVVLMLWIEPLPEQEADNGEDA